MLAFYKPPPAKILDCTCGYKHFWDKLKGGLNTSTLDGGRGYEVVFTDVRDVGDYQVDYRNILGKFPEWASSFDVVVYDPPYSPLTLRVNGVKKWLKNERYGMNSGRGSTLLSEEHFRLFVNQAFRLTKMSGIVIVKLQDTINFWHLVFYKKISPFRLEALYIHDLEQNWAENVDVKDAKKPIPIHAYWFILVK